MLQRPPKLSAQFHVNVYWHKSVLLPPEKFESSIIGLIAPLLQNGVIVKIKIKILKIIYHFEYSETQFIFSLF